jgi:RNA polymerase sigma factor (sigma-70 family)
LAGREIGIEREVVHMTEVGPSSPPAPVSGEAAVDELVRRYLPVVYGAARRQLPDASLAEDVTQAVFMVLARRHRGLPANVVLSSWLLKVTHLACLQARRNAGRRKRHERKAAQMRPTITPAETVPHGLLAAEVDSAIARLGETDRAVVTLRYLEEMSVANVARQLQISEAAAQKRIDRAIGRLRKQMGVPAGQLGAASLSAFFFVQNQLPVPSGLAATVSHAMATGGTAAASATAATIAQGVMKSLLWSGLKLPLLVGVVVVALTAGTVVVQQALSRDQASPLASSVQKPSAATPADHGRAASTNVPGATYPRVDDQRRVTFRLYAPQARRVAVEIRDTYEMAKGADGYWTVTTAPLVPGFHYYHFVVDGAAAADPASESCLGVSKAVSGLEVPDAGVDFYHLKDVPHGEVRARYYQSPSTQVVRQAFVYTPPSYDVKPAARFPVLYLVQGMGEDQRAWIEQGRLAEIMDNLIARGEAREMIVVVEDAGTAAGYAPRGGGRGGAGRSRGNAAAAFPQVFISETVPMIDATYRTAADREHRAMAGASLGAAQMFQITQDHLDLFSHVGSFSAPFGYPGVPFGYDGLLSDPDAFAKRIATLYVSAGSTEANAGARMFHEQLEAAGIAHTYYEAPGNGHGWHTWRKSLYGFAQLLFKERR